MKLEGTVALVSMRAAQRPLQPIEFLNKYTREESGASVYATRFGPSMSSWECWEGCTLA